jgi:hypothetical protein
MTRITRTRVQFRHAFSLSSVEGRQEPGVYQLVTEETWVGSSSDGIFERTATLLHMPAVGSSSQGRCVVLIDHQELADVLAEDIWTAPASS